MPRVPEVARLASALDAAARVGPVWSDYTLANHAVVFLDQYADTLLPACAFIWRFGKPLTPLAVTRRVELGTPLYGMWNGDSAGRNVLPNGVAIRNTFSSVPRNLDTALRALGTTRHERHGSEVRLGSWLGRNSSWVVPGLLLLAAILGMLALLIG